MVQTTCGAQCLVFSEVFDSELREAVGDGVDERLEDRLFIVANNENLFNLRDVRNGAEAVFDDGVASDGEEGLTSVSEC